MATRFAKYLGVFPQWQLSIGDLKTFWRGCAFDLSIYNVTDRFCTLFNSTQFYELEYSSDLSVCFPFLSFVLHRRFVVADQRRDAELLREWIRQCDQL